jgi:hypothetical protein
MARSRTDYLGIEKQQGTGLRLSERTARQHPHRTRVVIIEPSSPATNQCQGELWKRFWSNLHVALSCFLNGFGDGRGFSLVPEAKKIAPTQGGYSFVPEL